MSHLGLTIDKKVYFSVNSRRNITIIEESTLPVERNPTLKSKLSLSH